MRIIASTLIIALTIIACAPAEQTPTPDAVATGVAQQRAIAATLTAEAPVIESTQPLPTATEPAQATEAPPTDTPPAQDVVGQIVPAFGTTNGLEGEIRIHNYPGAVPDAPIVQQSIAFRLQVHDPSVGDQDGAGITSVDFFITELNSGETVHERTERVSGYCAFGGGEPVCDVFDFAENNFTWTNGQSIVDGFFEVQAIVHTQDPNKDGANWGFTFEVRLP
jgi:hypothetical protein